MIANRPGSRWRNSASLSHYSLTITQFSVSPCWKSLPPFPREERGGSVEGNGRKSVEIRGTSRVESAIGNRNQPAITPISESFSPPSSPPTIPLFANGSKLAPRSSSTNGSRHNQRIVVCITAIRPRIAAIFPQFFVWSWFTN